ncbi:TBC1 domain family member 12-like [Arapaima gigas]
MLDQKSAELAKRQRPTTCERALYNAPREPSGAVRRRASCSRSAPRLRSSEQGEGAREEARDAVNEMEKAENGAAHRLASSVNANGDEDEEEEEAGAASPARKAGSREYSQTTSPSQARIGHERECAPQGQGNTPGFTVEAFPELGDECGRAVLNGFAGTGGTSKMLLLDGVLRVAGQAESPPPREGPCAARAGSCTCSSESRVGRADLSDSSQVRTADEEEPAATNGTMLMGVGDPGRGIEPPIATTSCTPHGGALPDCPQSAPLSPASSSGSDSQGSCGVPEGGTPPPVPHPAEPECQGAGPDGHPPPDRIAPPKRLTLRTHPKGAVSLSCDATPLSPSGPHEFTEPPLSSRNTFEANRRQSAPDHLPDGLSVAEEPSLEQALKQKKYAISDFFARSLFSRKQKDPRPAVQSAPGWKLFGKVPPRENPQKDSKTIQQDGNSASLTSVSTPNLLSAGEYEARIGKATNTPSQSQHGRRKNLEFEPLSTTALILEDRPANLPAKSAEEAQRHRQEYDEMVAEAKKREMKEAQRKKKLMKERFRQEENIANAMVIWNTEILPNWENMRHTRRVRELWWQGLPPSIRGKVWSLAIGNELNITHELYEIFLSRAKERWRSFSETGLENDVEDSAASLADRESSLDLIKLDISRTFPSLFIFQKGGPYHDLLHSVLGAYTCYRPDVGYVQGMSFIAAVLILNLEEADAFIAFANLLNKPCQMAFFRVDHDLMLKYFAAFEVFFEENLPRLFSHFKSSNLTPDLYLIDWIFTLYSKSLPLDLACRVWDVFCRDGEEYLFRTGLGILRLYEDVLLQMDFIHIAQFLTRLPEDIAPEKLFGCIAAVQMLSGNRKWTQVFSALMKDKEMDKNNSPALKS